MFLQFCLKFIHSKNVYLWGVCCVPISTPGISRSQSIFLFRAAPELGIAKPDEEIEAKGGEVEEMRERMYKSFPHLEHK